MTPEQMVSGLTHATPFNTMAAMAPGSYVVEYPSPWGATGAMALDDGYVASVYAKSPSVHFDVTLGNMPRDVKAGEEIKYRLVLMQGHPNATAQHGRLGAFCQDHGIPRQAGV